MASRALVRFEMESFNTVRLVPVFANRADDAKAGSAAMIAQEEGPYVSTREDLRLAKGTLVAMGLNAAAVLCLLGAWEFWRSFR